MINIIKSTILLFIIIVIIAIFIEVDYHTKDLKSFAYML